MEYEQAAKEAKQWLATTTLFNSCKGVALSAVIQFLLYKDKQNETKE